MFKLAVTVTVSGPLFRAHRVATSAGRRVKPEMAYTQFVRVELHLWTYPWQHWLTFSWQPTQRCTRSPYDLADSVPNTSEYPIGRWIEWASGSERSYEE